MIHFVGVTFTSTKDTASSYIFKRIFVSMPIRLLAFFFFYLICLTSFTEVGAGSNLSVSKEAKTNYMGRFIFSRGGVLGDHLLIPFFLFFAYFYYVQ